MKIIDIIVNYFSERDTSEINVLEIGSNCLSLGLINMGCNAYLVEPSPILFAKINELYNENDKVKCFPFAISTNNGMIDFKEIDSVINVSDETINRTENIKYNTIKVIGLDFYTFTVTVNQSKFNFVNMDCNLFDFDVLKQIDLNNIGCEMIVINFNGKYKEMYMSHITSFGFKAIYDDNKNLIFTKI